MAENIVAESEAHLRNQPGAERRAQVRFALSQDIFCQPKPFSAADGQPTGWLRKLWNISRGGLGLVVNQRFERGTELAIELGVNGAVGSIAVREVHTTVSTGGRWIIGYQFLRPLSEEELQALVGE